MKRDEVAWFVDGEATTTITGVIRAINSKGKIVYERTLDDSTCDPMPLRIREKSPYTGDHDGMTLELSHSIQLASFDDGGKK